MKDKLIAIILSVITGFTLTAVLTGIIGIVWDGCTSFVSHMVEWFGCSTTNGWLAWGLLCVTVSLICYWSIRKENKNK